MMQMDDEKRRQRQTGAASLPTWESADAARQALGNMQATARIQQTTQSMPQAPSPVTPAPRNSGRGDYDPLALGQNETETGNGAFWGKLKDAYFYNSDKAASEQRRQDAVGASFLRQPPAATTSFNRSVAGPLLNGAAGENPFGIKPTLPHPEKPSATGFAASGSAQATPAAAAATGSVQRASQAQAQAIAPGIYQHGRGQFSDNPEGMGFRLLPQSAAAPAMPGNGISSGADAAQRVAEIYKSAAAGQRGLSFSPELAARYQNQTMGAAPVALHSGNSWEARNHLRNLEIGAKSLMNERGFITPGRHGQQQPTAAQQAYADAVKADLQARGAQAGLDQEAMRQRAGFGVAGLKEQAANQRAALDAGLDQSRLGLDARKQAEVERNGAISRASSELQLEQARRLDAIRQEMANATTPEARAAAEKRWVALAGDFAGQANKWRGVELSGGADPMGNRNPSVLGLYNEATGEVRYPGQQGALAALDSQEVQAVLNDTKLSKAEREAKLRMMGFT